MPRDGGNIPHGDLVTAAPQRALIWTSNHLGDDMTVLGPAMLTATEIAGFVGAGLAGAAYVPQISHLIKARCSAGISRLAFEVWLPTPGNEPGSWRPADRSIAESATSAEHGGALSAYSQSGTRIPMRPPNINRRT